MRGSVRRTAIWLAVGAVGAAMALAGMAFAPLPDGVVIALGGIGGALALFGLVGGALMLPDAIAERRLARGKGVIARWSVPPSDWVAFLAADARHAAGQPGLRNRLVARPPDGRPVEVVVGARHVLMDEALHAVAGLGAPQAMAVAWRSEAGVAACVQIVARASRGPSGGYAWSALRIPVPHAARDEAARAFRALEEGVPAHAVAWPLRHPGLVAAWGFGFWAVALCAALGGWLLGIQGVLVAGLVVAGIAWIGTLVLLGAALLRRAVARSTSGPSPPR